MYKVKCRVSISEDIWIVFGDSYPTPESAIRWTMDQCETTDREERDFQVVRYIVGADVPKYNFICVD